ncbi:MAG: N-acetylmuramoyl-L-alanine amidase [Flavobacteriales bacterium]|nr:N-acetylmuramoyl-L-alanine amidase [Flavobacteriales bacterium]
MKRIQSQTNKRMVTLHKRMALLFLALTFSFFVGFTLNESTGKIQTIVLDAGHGGSDPGNLGTGRYKTTEKDITLDVTLRLKKYIEEQYPEIKIILTRDGDTFPSLNDRVEIANTSKADLFISIHCDAFTKSSAKGSGTYVMGMHRSKESLRVSMKENASIYREENYEQNYSFDPDDPDTYIALTLRQNTYLDQSLLLSKKIQDQFRDRVGRVDRGVRQAGFFVICFTSMPSALVELGFLTNPDEEDFLNSENGKSYMASAIFRAFKEYKMDIEGVKVEVVEEVTPVAPPKEENEPVADTNSEEDTANKGEWVDKITYKKIKKGVRYQVQIATSSVNIPLTPEQFNGLTQVDEYFSNGLFKYAAGSTKSFDEAKAMQAELRKHGFTGAFVIAFNDNERIALDEALMKQP